MTVLWVCIGWLGNAFFFSRFLVQWLLSERARKTVAPRSFWWLSLVGTALQFAYTFHQREPVLLVGFAVNGMLYARNLQLAYATRGAPRLASAVVMPAAVAAVAILLLTGLGRFAGETTSSALWLTIGIAGQSIWCSRFVLQWVASERRGESHFPRVFWWISLAGNLLLLAYTIHLGDAVWIAGLALGPLVQIRNLMLGAKRRALGASAQPPSGALAEHGRAAASS